MRQHYDQALNESHHGHPIIVESIHTGGRGRPSIHINEEFLRWAYTMRSTSSITRFLGVSRRTVRNALLEYGIAEPRSSPFTNSSHPVFSSNADESGLFSDNSLGDLHLPPIDAHTSLHDAEDPILNPTTGLPSHSPTSSHITSYTGPLSTISNAELDGLIAMLRNSYIRAGITILDGMLRQLGYRIPRSRIRESLLRIDPVQRVFERIRIRRRVYSVPGPNSLWHHDGQHGTLNCIINKLLHHYTESLLGLIRWGIVIHGFIDGYSRLITGLRASNNNLGDTVLDLFLQAANVYGVPSRLRGDHGVENIKVAAWMEVFQGTARGSYIWGRLVTF